MIGPKKTWFSAWKPWSRFLPGPTCIEVKCMILRSQLHRDCEIRRKTFTLPISFSLLRILPQEWKNWVKMFMTFQFHAICCELYENIISWQSEVLLKQEIHNISIDFSHQSKHMWQVTTKGTLCLIWQFWDFCRIQESIK